MIKKYDRVLYNVLLEQALIPKKSLDSLLEEIEFSGETLQQLLVKRRLLPERDILNVLAEKLKIKCLDLKSIFIEKTVLEKVPVKIATYYKFLPVKIAGRVLTIAVTSPLDIKMQDEIRTQLGYDVEIVLSCTEDIARGLEKYYGIASDTLEEIDSDSDVKTEGSSSEITQERIDDIEKLAEDASVIKLVNQIILEAWRKRATDIHIEPYRNKVFLRYRVDGILYETNISPRMKDFLSAIISRIKIMSNLNIVERRLPQDGRAIVRVQEQVLDLRISTIPTPFGESVVIRILPANMLFSMEKLGLADMDLKIFDKLIKKPHGIIFVTGPTGSGKTTSLYACLSTINTKERKIITIEDPIEYEMAGITQMQVMPEIGLSFARGLRSILRHDPDVIMVGEVRDLETAEIAIRVALTGHLVFSTLHTNDAVSGIARLVDIGVEPYLVASSVDAFIAQRLIRVICPDCKHEDDKTQEGLKNIIAKELELKSNEIKIFRGKGCPNCNFTGFFGRTAIYEILLLDEEIKELVLKKVPSGQIKEIAISKGMRILRKDGWRKVIEGITTLEEVMRVSPIEEHMDVERNIPKIQDTRLSNDERRIYKRSEQGLRIRYNVFKSQEEVLKKKSVPEESSITRDFSAGGLVFISDRPLSLGSILELKIDVPNEKTIECLSRVVRIEEIEKAYSIAVCFLDIASAQRAMLEGYSG